MEEEDGTLWTMPELMDGGKVEKENGTHRRMPELMDGGNVEKEDGPNRKSKLEDEPRCAMRDEMHGRLDFVLEARSNGKCNAKNPYC